MRIAGVEAGIKSMLLLAYTTANTDERTSIIPALSQIYVVTIERNLTRYKSKSKKCPIQSPKISGILTLKVYENASSAIHALL